MEAVKAATADVHARLERRVDLDRISRSLDRYVAFLRASYTVTSALEPRLASHLPGDVFDDLYQPSRRIRGDLSALGVPAPAEYIDELGVECRGSALGAAYVLLGSQLGGAVIGRVIAVTLDLPAAAVSFLSAPDNPIGPRWKRFSHYVNGWGISAPGDERQAFMQTAERTFIAYDEQLSSFHLDRASMPSA